MMGMLLTILRLYDSGVPFLVAKLRWDDGLPMHRLVAFDIGILVIRKSRSTGALGIIAFITAIAERRTCVSRTRHRSRMVNPQTNSIGCRCKSQHIAEVSTIILLGKRRLPLIQTDLNLRPILLFKTAIFPDQQNPQRQRQQSGEEHESGTDRHPLYISWCLCIGEDIRPEERSTLTDDVKQNDSSTAAGIRALIVYTCVLGYGVDDAISVRGGRENDSLSTQGRMFAIDGNTPQAARKTPKYRTPTDVQVAHRRYPTPPIADSPAIMNPRCWMRSATQVLAIVAMKDARKGGAVRPWALIAVKPISLRIVGRKTGRLEKLTLQLKYIN